MTETMQHISVVLPPMEQGASGRWYIALTDPAICASGITTEEALTNAVEAFRNSAVLEAAKAYVKAHTALVDATGALDEP